MIESFSIFLIFCFQLHDNVVLHGQKVSQSDGITIDSNGIMYFGDISTNSVKRWNTRTPLTSSNQKFLAQNSATLQWQDTFGFAQGGRLIFVTNRLQLFPTLYDFTGNSGWNFRINSIIIDAGSYMDGALNIQDSLGK